MIEGPLPTQSGHSCFVLLSQVFKFLKDYEAIKKTSHDSLWAYHILQRLMGFHRPFSFAKRPL